MSSSLPRRLASLAVVAVLAPAVAGCAIGVNAQTNMQGASGDGAVATTGPLEAAGLTLVLGEKPGAANLIGTVVNVGGTDDAIAGVTLAGGGSATLIDGAAQATSIPLPARTRTQFGYDNVRRIPVDGIDVAAGRFVTVTITYRAAGTATVPVLTVAATGVYAGLGPVIKTGS